MKKPTIFALLTAAVVTTVTATQMVEKPSTAALDAVMQESKDNAKPVQRITRITVEQSEEMKKNLENRTLEQANQHLENLPRKNVDNKR